MPRFRKPARRLAPIALLVLVAPAGVWAGPAEPTPGAVAPDASIAESEQDSASTPPGTPSANEAPSAAAPSETAPTDDASNTVDPIKAEAAEEDPADDLAADPADDPAESDPPALAPDTWLVLPRVGDYRRQAFHTDPVEHQLATGAWQTPEPGAECPTADGGVAAWRNEDATDPGANASDLAGGYAYGEFTAAADGVRLLVAPGCAALWLNGEWLPGDPYGVGWFRVPAPISKGVNRVVAHLARPDARPRFITPPADFAWAVEAAVVPNLPTDITDDQQTLLVSVPIVNATSDELRNGRLHVAWADADGEGTSDEERANDATEEAEPPIVTPLRTIAARLITPITIETPPLPAGEHERLTLAVEALANDGDDPIARVELVLRQPAADGVATRTFRSAIDGSVQPYAVRRPAAKTEPAGGVDSRSPGIVVLLHDAGETAERALSGARSLPGAWQIAPGGRGAWGFDWEDWSRLDALEALDDFIARAEARDVPIDTGRIAVVGRGMGGHGALRLATLDPDRFHAVGVTDPWISFYTQGRATAPPPNASPRLLAFAGQASANDPGRLLENLADARVAVRATRPASDSATEARFLRRRLGEFHDDFSYARHTPSDPNGVRWLLRPDGSIDNPADRPTDRANGDAVTFTTPGPGLLATRGWATVEAIRRPGRLARVRLARNAAERTVRGVTDNVTRLSLRLPNNPSAKPAAQGKRTAGAWTLRLDRSAAVEARPRGGRVWLARDADGEWSQAPAPDAALSGFVRPLKSPSRAGGFKSAFGSQPVLVYGERGPEGVRSWSAAKARYDAHTFLYRGAGRLPVVAIGADLGVAPTIDSARAGARSAAPALSGSLVLYGNERSNPALALLRRDPGVRVLPREVRVGGRPERGDDLAVVAIRPRRGSRAACVAVVGGTGEVGMRLTTRLRYFWSGVTYPDLAVFDSGAIGSSDWLPAVRAAGYYDADWSVGKSLLWRDLAL